MDYLHVQADNPWYNYYKIGFCRYASIFVPVAGQAINFSCIQSCIIGTLGEAAIAGVHYNHCVCPSVCTSVHPLAVSKMTIIIEPHGIF